MVNTAPGAISVVKKCGGPSAAADPSSKVTVTWTTGQDGPASGSTSNAAFFNAMSNGVESSTLFATPCVARAPSRISIDLSIATHPLHLFCWAS